MKRLAYSLLATVFFVLAFTGCEKLAIPEITNTSIEETEPGVIEATATMTSKEIDDCGIIYSSRNSTPTLENHEGKVEGTLKGDQFSATLNLKTNTNYYFIFYATNELGTTYSTSINRRTSTVKPGPDDNPFPNP